MNAKPRQVLINLIRTYGAPLSEDRSRCSGLLRDLCLGQCKPEINLLLLALEEGVPVLLQGEQGRTPPEILVKRLVKRLREERHLTEEAALWAVESWAFALIKGYQKAGSGSAVTPMPKPTNPPTTPGIQKPSPTPSPTPSAGPATQKPKITPKPVISNLGVSYPQRRNKPILLRTLGVVVALPLVLLLALSALSFLVGTFYAALLMIGSLINKGPSGEMWGACLGIFILYKMAKFLFRITKETAALAFKRKP